MLLHAETMHALQVTYAALRHAKESHAHVLERYYQACYVSLSSS